jgi:hypothetical protein
MSVTIEKPAIVCNVCGETVNPPVDGISTGYGTDADGNHICFACCGDRDRQSMVDDDRIDLYLVNIGETRYKVTNWPGTLSMLVHSRAHGRHFVPGYGYTPRVDVWFTGPEGRQWHGVQRGDNNDICRCRKLKA